MTKWNLRSKKFNTGGKRSRLKKHKKYQKARNMNPVEIKDSKLKKVRGRGGGLKTVMLSSNKVNLISKGKAEPAVLQEVLENSADSHYVRRNIITKGAVIKTDKGKAIVTSRPGQDGTISAKLVEEAKE